MRQYAARNWHQATRNTSPQLTRSDKRAQGASRSFPGLKRNDVAELVDTLGSRNSTPGDAADAIRVLRDQADSLYIRARRAQRRPMSSIQRAWSRL